MLCDGCETWCAMWVVCVQCEMRACACVVGQARVRRHLRASADCGSAHAERAKHRLATAARLLAASSHTSCR
jgi:hypothetical protein